MFYQVVAYKHLAPNGAKTTTSNSDRFVFPLGHQAVGIFQGFAAPPFCAIHLMAVMLGRKQYKPPLVVTNRERPSTGTALVWVVIEVCLCAPHVPRLIRWAVTRGRVRWKFKQEPSERTSIFTCTKGSPASALQRSNLT